MTSPWANKRLFALVFFHASLPAQYISAVSDWTVISEQAELQPPSSTGQRSDATRPGIEPDAEPWSLLTPALTEPLFFSWFSQPLSVCLGENTDPSLRSGKYLTSYWWEHYISFSSDVALKPALIRVRDTKCLVCAKMQCSATVLNWWHFHKL